MNIADGLNVIVIGGGDTGTDCVATAIRQGCKSLVQFELLAKPAEKLVNHDGWLSTVRTFQVDYGQHEATAVFGTEPREYSISTTRFIGVKGNLTGLETEEIKWENGRMIEIKDTQKIWKAETVFLAMGFTGVDEYSFFDELGVQITDGNTIAVNENKQTNVTKIFAAGDCERGQSLVVWAIADGRDAAVGVHKFLLEKTEPVPILSIPS